jgi:hypothetical protein
LAGRRARRCREESQLVDQEAKERGWRTYRLDLVEERALDETLVKKKAEKNEKTQVSSASFR